MGGRSAHSPFSPPPLHWSNGEIGCNQNQPALSAMNTVKGFECPSPGAIARHKPNVRLLLGICWQRRKAFNRVTRHARLL
jgi:hypothetical protein